MKTGETKTGELKRPRDYSLEHKRRKEKKTRLLVDMDKNKAEAFTGVLNKQGITFSKWINEQIDIELSKRVK
jgi:hypothetical protein